MEFALIGVIGVITVVAVAAFSKQLGVAAPLVLVVVGVAASFLPGLPSPLAVPPWVILSVVLPPLLYSSAVQVPVMDVRRNLGTISVLSVVLVIASALVIGALLYVLLPQLNLAAAIALGAIVSPTDAVAATSMAKRFGLPARLVTLLEAESLVNDASALVLLKAAVGAAGAGVSLWAIGGDFLYSVIAASAVGFTVGLITVFVRSRLNDSVLETAVSFAVPFIAYIPAEYIGASGVLAVVVAGIYTGHHAARSFTAQARISERVNWRTIQFLLENGVFLLMGLELKTIAISVPHGQFGAWASVGLGVGLCILLAAIRGAVMTPIVMRLRVVQRRADELSGHVSAGLEKLRTRHERQGPPRDEHTQRRRTRMKKFMERREADVTDMQDASIGWRGGLVLTWAGMRGVVTLAAAQSLPVATPYRPQLVLIAFTVAIVTLLVQGGTLPAIIRLAHVRGTDAAADRREIAGLLEELSEAGLSALSNPDVHALGHGQTFDPDVVERVRNDTLLKVEAGWERAERDQDDAAHVGPHQQYRSLRSQVLAAERDALLEARSRGSYPSRVLLHAQAMLDLEESRLAQRESDA